MNRLSLTLATVAALLANAPFDASAQCSTYPTLCGLPVHSTIEQPDLEIAIDIVLVGDGYRFSGATDTDNWAGVAANFINAIKTYTNSNLYQANLYNFHVVDVPSATTDVGDTDTSDTALGMRSTGSTSISADESKASTAASNAPDVDLVITIANTGSGRANAYFASGLATGSSIRITNSPSAITHEMGHAFFALADEYEDSGICPSHANDTESTFVGHRNMTKDATCYKYNTTPGAGCVQGGSYCPTGFFRSAAGCLMRASGNAAMCPVCARTRDEMLLEKRTGVDQAEPWIVITSPAMNATVTGTTEVRASTFDDWFAPTTVSFYVDGIFKAQTTSASTYFSFNFDSTTATDGVHTLTMVASDTRGHARQSAPIAITISNSSDTSAPTVTIASPTNGSHISDKGTINVTTANANDIELLTLSIDGVLVMATGANSIYYNWDLTTVAVGSHTIAASAVDRTQNIGNATPVTVTVDAPTGSGGGQTFVYIMAPATWTAVGDLFELRYGVAGVSAGTPVDLLVDRVALSPSPLPSIPADSGGSSGGVEGGGSTTVIINSANWSAGPHELKLSAGGSESLPVVVYRIDGSDPFVAFTYPTLASGCLMGTINVTGVGYDNVGITSVELLVDGSPVASRTGVPFSIPLNTTTLDGTASLSLRASDADGNTFVTSALHLSVDNAPPTVSITAPQNGDIVPPGPLLVTTSALDDECGVTTQELFVDGTKVSTAARFGGSLFATLTVGSHSLYVRAIDGAGHATNSASVTITVADCAVTGCNDSQSCTVDTCAATGKCLHKRTVNCCATNPDCDDLDPCTTDTCATGSCQHSPVAACCTSPLTCGDGDSCTVDSCGAANTCAHSNAGCCTTPGDCDDGNGCTTDACNNGPNGVCSHTWAPSCCRDAGDCDDDNPCTADSCNAGTCNHVDNPTCCAKNDDCNDGDICTWDQCINNACTNPPRMNCCLIAADCANLNPCATWTCSSNSCSPSTPVVGCCNFAWECDDADAHTDDACVENACTHTIAPNYCDTIADCTDDGDICTADACTANRCVAPAILNCCHDVADCDDGLFCSTDSCTSNLCEHAVVADCCENTVDCNDSDECTTDLCNASHTCEHTAIDPCHPADSGPDADGAANDGALADGAGNDDGAPASEDDPVSDDAAVNGDPASLAKDGVVLTSNGCSCRTNDAPWLAGFAAVFLLLRRRRQAITNEAC